MSRASALVLLVAACSKPPLDDPAEVAYHHAIELFAKASADTGDLTYRHPRFDEVLTALAAVPATDELRLKADALAQQIQQARADADRADVESKQAVSQALQPPEFSPMERDAPFPAAGKKPAAKAESAGAAPRASTDYGYVGSGPPTVSSRPSSSATPLPEWYSKAGYFGLGKHPAGPKPPEPTPNVMAGPPAIEEPSEAPGSPATPASAPTAPVDQGPPPIYGLPGPAQRAMTGR